MFEIIKENLLRLKNRDHKTRVADPGKNLHAGPDPDPGGIRGVKGKMKKKSTFFMFQMFLNNFKLIFEKEIMKYFFGSKLPETDDLHKKNINGVPKNAPFRILNP